MKYLKQHLVYLTACFFLFGGAVATGQEIKHPRGFYIRAELVYIHLFSPRYSPLIDPLTSIQPDNNAVGLEMQWQSRRRWGVFFQYTFIHSLNSVRKTFREQLQQVFPYDYISEDIKGIPEPYQSSEGPLQGLLGVSYAFDRGKWNVQPRLFLGGSSFFPLSADVALKRVGTNQLSKLSFKPVNAEQDGSTSAFTFGAGAMAQWHFWRRWSLYGSLQYSTSRWNLQYSYQMADQVTGVEDIQLYESDKRWLHNVRAGAGLTLRLTRQPL